MVFETKEQIIKRKRAARYRFQRIALSASRNPWIADQQDTKLGDDALKNVAIILNRSQRTEHVQLLLHDKTALRKPLEKRTEPEILHLEQLFEKLPCFQQFSPIIRKKLVNVVDFQYFEKDRWLYKEGDKSYSMCFLLTGDAVVSKNSVDSEKHETCNQPVNLLTNGDCFGHVGLINDSTRNASVFTKTDCELLCLYKEDFDLILKDVMATKHENIKQAIRRFEYFKNFTDEKITECCVISKIDQFSPQQIIFSQNDILNFSFFVLSGKCMILQLLKLKDKGNGRCELVLPKKKLNPLELAMAKIPPRGLRDTGIASMLESDEKGIKYQFIDVGSYYCGGVFGIGEDIDNRIIIARNVVQCLLVPRHWLFQKAQNIGNVWQRIKLFLNSSIPSQQKLFDSYLANQKWKNYKKKTIEEIKKQHGITASDTKFYNIPVICRIENK